MGREVLTGWIDEDAKRGWEGAAALVPSQSRKGNASLTELLDQLGVALGESVAQLREEHANETPECRIEIRVVAKEAVA
jgi:hypothetical protein